MAGTRGPMTIHDDNLGGYPGKKPMWPKIEAGTRHSWPKIQRDRAGTRP